MSSVTGHVIYYIMCFTILYTCMLYHLLCYNIVKFIYPYDRLYIFHIQFKNVE